jgi:hypothetical protein
LKKNQLIISCVTGWIEKAVIGLELCPFAESTYSNNKVRYMVSETKTIEPLMLELYQYCQFLIDTPEIETGLLIIPYQLEDFLEFNQTLEQVDALIEVYEWRGIFQVASFHPKYQFKDTKIDDRENWTNRSPYPILQILRETSVERVLSSYPNPELIPDKNIQKLTDMDSSEFEYIFKPS